MARILLLDSGPLGLACDSLGKPSVLSIRNRLWDETIRGTQIIIPAVADYEVRRSLILEKLEPSLARLDEFHQSYGRYLPITQRAMNEAARLWAEAKRLGMMTKGEESFDGDLILAAQALAYCTDADDWRVITENERHLARYLPGHIELWQRGPLHRIPGRQVNGGANDVIGDELPD